MRGLALLPLAAAVALGGCGHVSKLSPGEAVGLVQAFAAAGCKGDVHVAVGGATGQLGGGAHAEVTANGQCDPSAVKPPAAGAEPQP